MTFRLRPSKALDKEVGRAARAEFKRVKKLLTAPVEDPEESIHQLRVGMKRMRALLRLVRDALGEDAYRAEQARCKALADSYAGSRDAAVGFALCDDLLRDCPDPEQRQRLRDGVQRTLPVPPDQYPSLDDAALGVDRMRTEVGDWPLGPLRLRQLNDRLARQYRDGLKLCREVQDDNAMALMHAWRTVVKRLLYQLELIPPGCSVPKLDRRLKRLGALLGDIHDLDMLGLQVESRPEAFWLDDRLMLGRLLNERRTALRGRALKLGGKIFADSPESFARRRLKDWQRGR